MREQDAKMIESPQQRRGRRRLWRTLATGLISVGLVGVGAAGMALTQRYAALAPSGPAAALPPAAAAPAVTVPTVASSDTDVDLVLSPDAIAQAGITTATVAVVETNVAVQVPGMVMANAYREIRVIPLIAGIITRVHAELGMAVKQGAPLATLFSSELADAQTKYLSMKAMLEADRQKHERTHQLVALGAASQQELEEVTAVHAGHATEVEAARQRLLLLGLTRKQVDALRSPSQSVSEIVVRAPIGGMITSRTVNPGQVVGMGQEVFVVTDLSEIWAVGDLYEQDFASVQLGSEATVVARAYPDLLVRGRVAYIDPRVDSQTRTAKVRVEVPNPDGRLRLGMYVTMSFTTRRGEPEVVVPSAAVQTIGERHVVFVAVEEEAGKFVQRSVQIGRLVGDSYTIRSGLQPGEAVATEGSFFLRAESLRNAPSS